MQQNKLDETDNRVLKTKFLIKQVNKTRNK